MNLLGSAAFYRHPRGTTDASRRLRSWAQTSPGDWELRTRAGGDVEHLACLDVFFGEITRRVFYLTPLVLECRFRVTDLGSRVLGFCSVLVAPVGVHKVFSAAPLVYFCFCCFCEWCQIQKPVTKTNVRELTACFCLASGFRS